MWWKEYQTGSHSFGFSPVLYLLELQIVRACYKNTYGKTKKIFANPVIGVFWTSKEKNRVLELEDDLESKGIVLPTSTCNSLVKTISCQSLSNVVT